MRSSSAPFSQLQRCFMIFFIALRSKLRTHWLCEVLLVRVSETGSYFIFWVEFFLQNSSIEHRYTQRNLFEILLNQTEIWLHVSFSEWFGSKRKSVWIQISQKMVNTIWFQCDLKRFPKDFSVCRIMLICVCVWINRWTISIQHKPRLKNLPLLSERLSSLMGPQIRTP